MALSVKSLLNGFVHRMGKKKKERRFSRLSWAKEKVLKHQDETTVKQMRFGQLSIAYKRPYELMHTYRELFEDEIYAFTARTSSPLIIDCGANIGLSVLYFKSLYPNSRLIAYEPDADNLSLLQQNIVLNNLSDVECQQKAVWVNNDELLFASDGTQGSGIASGRESANVIKVQAQRLADVLKNMKVDFLKIDIEGAELDVVKDCAPFFHNVENMFVEYHGKASESEKLAQLLTVLKANFQVYIKMAADALQQPFVEKTTGASFDVQLNIFCYPFH